MPIGTIPNLIRNQKPQIDFELVLTEFKVDSAESLELESNLNESKLFRSIPKSVSEPIQKNG